MIEWLKAVRWLSCGRTHVRRCCHSSEAGAEELDALTING
jgi:hypothetical protein